MKRNLVSKMFGIALVFVMVASMLGGLTGTATAAKFSIGDTVEVTDNLNVRTGPGTSYPEITDPDYPGYAPKGTLGKIVSGPSSADGYIWWEVDYGPGLYSGWSVENWLEKSTSITDQQKQQKILNMVNNHRGSLPPELVLAIIRQEGGEGAFHIDGWNYNSFYRESDGPWAQPTNGDGIMQVTTASGYHERSGPYTHDQDGYDHAINDGCDYLLENYDTYGSYVQTTLHYNTGPNSLYIYLGKNWGDRNYLSHAAGHLSSFVPNIYGLENPNLVDALNQGQSILNDYLYNKGIATGQSVDYYRPYQTQLDNDLYNIEYPDTTSPTVDAFSVTPYSLILGNAFTISYTVSDTGGSGLKQIELWRANDIGGVPDWGEYPIDNPKDVTPLSGQTSYSGSFSDAPPSVGSYWYGMHVVDNAGNWAPEDSPIEVEVTSIQPAITFYTDPTDGGTIIFDGSTYSNGQGTTKTDGTYSVSANPASNYVFDHWSTTGGVSVSNSNSQSTSATVSGDGSIKAWFKYVLGLYTLTISSTSGGSVSVPGEGVHGLYDHGTVVNLIATPDPDYAFLGWSGDVGTIDDENSTATNITMYGNYSIMAHFGPRGISALPASLNFIANEGENPLAQTLEVCNSGSGTLNWSLTDNAGWLSETPTSGSLGEGECEDVTVSVDVTGMAVGDYSATITITGSPMLEVPVSLHISVPTPGIIYVPDDYAKIQWAVDNATSGDTIIVRDGTYTENVDVNKDHLTIQSENGAVSTIVQAATSNDHVFNVATDWVNITGFIVKGATGLGWAGIRLTGADHCNISSNKLTNNFIGIWLDSSSNSTLSNNTASNSNIAGIRLEWSSNTNLTDNICSNNTYTGISLLDSGNSRLTNNTCLNNSDGISLCRSNNSMVTNNTASNNKFGIALVTMSGCTLDNNTANSNDWHGIFLVSSNHNTLTNNTASNNTQCGIVPFLSSSNTIYFNNIIDNANNVDSIDSTNFWNSPEEITYTYNGSSYTSHLGNYWGDYSAYLLPVGHNNPGTIYLITGDTYYWQDEALAYDENIETYAKVWVGDIQFGPWLELFAPPKPSQGIRFWLGPWINYGIHPTVELFYDGGWHFLTEWKDGQWRVLDEYREGNIPPKGEWIEIDYPEQMVEKARIMYGPDTLGSRGYAQLHEFQFKTTSSDADGDGIWDIPYTIDSDKDNYPLVEPFESYEIGPANQPPLASFTYSPESPVSSGGIIQFDASDSDDPDGTIVSYEWDFRDGETAMGCNVSHRFRGAMDEQKEYVVELTVEDDKGVAATVTASVIVKPLEKTVEVTHIPRTPLEAEAFARMKVSYNWVDTKNGEDIYIVSRIRCSCSGFFGGYALFILDTHSRPEPTVIWWDILSSLTEEKIYASPFPTFVHPSFSRLFPNWEPCSCELRFYGEDFFEGFEVYGSDVMSIRATGWPEGYYLGTDWRIIMIEVLATTFFEESSAYFQPESAEMPHIPIDINDLDLAHLCSSGELRVYDSQGRVTGLVSGEIKEGIPDSVYFDGTVVIFSSSDSYRYEVEGTDEGSYGLGVTSVEDGEATIFTATDIPTAFGAVHQYTIDWDALSLGGEGVTLQIDDDGDGTFEQTITSDATLEPPIAEADGPYIGDEGSPITFNASGSYDPDGNITLYEWDFDSDGIYDSSSASSNITHTWGDDYNGIVTLRVTDDEGLTDVNTTQVTVNNVPPIVEAGPNITAECCVDEISLNATFTDPGSLDTHTAAIDWGDGTVEAGTVGEIEGTVNGSHTYTGCGTFTLTLTVTDDDGGIGVDAATVTVVDTTPPEVKIEVPTGGAALQDGVTLTATASDLCRVAETYFYIREPNGTGIPIGYEDLMATLNPSTGKWECLFDTTLLSDGYYVVLAKAVDNYSNEGWSEVVPFSIRNWAVLELLPASQSNKGGRTMPVKFSLRIAESVDPAQPFVYNEELEIRIYDQMKPGSILQTSLYGDTSRDYRIDSVGEQYITNFKTKKQPAMYTVEIWRTSKNFLIGSFTFETVQ